LGFIIILQYVDETNYWAQSLVNLSKKAKELKSLTLKKLMVTDGRRLFVTKIPINYTPTVDQVKKVENLLEDMDYQGI
jgi:hypothetical protein